MSRVALVTGATSGIGRAITERFLKLGYRVYGVGRDFSKIDFDSREFIEIEANLSNSKELNSIKDRVKDRVDILVNSAGFGIFQPLETISAQDIEKLTAVNLIAPMTLCRDFLRDIRDLRGYIFNITSIEALRYSRFATVYGATKSALRSFSLSLFEEVRKSNVKVIVINPDITKTNFFENLNFKEGSNPLSYIEPKSIADAIESCLNMPDGSLISEMTIKTQIVQIEKKKIDKVVK